MIENKYSLKFARMVKNPKSVRFDSLQPGDIFEDMDCFYMKLEPLLPSTVNAVNITFRGQCYTFTNDALVIPRTFLLEEVNG